MSVSDGSPSAVHTAICKFYQSGFCRFGSSCKNVHDGSSSFDGRGQGRGRGGRGRSGLGSSHEHPNPEYLSYTTYAEPFLIPPSIPGRGRGRGGRGRSGLGSSHEHPNPEYLSYSTYAEPFLIPPSIPGRGRGRGRGRSGLGSSYEHPNPEYLSYSTYAEPFLIPPSIPLEPTPPIVKFVKKKRGQGSRKGFECEIEKCIISSKAKESALRQPSEISETSNEILHQLTEFDEKRRSILLEALRAIKIAARVGRITPDEKLLLKSQICNGDTYSAQVIGKLSENGRLALRNEFSTREKEHKISFGLCVICDEEAILLKVTSRCAHPNEYCKECIVKHITTLVVGGSVRIACPSLECRSYMEGIEVLSLLRHNRELYDKADKIFLDEVTSDDIVYCANSSCRSGFSLVDKDQTSFFLCSSCEMKTCVNCQVLWHTGLTCKQYKDSSPTAMTEAFLNERSENIKPCPRCSRLIEKDPATCNVARCCREGDEKCTTILNCTHGGLCGTRFCWLCLGLIENDGARHHNVGCKFNFDGHNPTRCEFCRVHAHDKT